MTKPSDNEKKVNYDEILRSPERLLLVDFLFNFGYITGNTNIDLPPSEFKALGLKTNEIKILIEKHSSELDKDRLKELLDAIDILSKFDI
jgi:alpha-mannosidase